MYYITVILIEVHTTLKLVFYMDDLFTETLLDDLVCISNSVLRRESPRHEFESQQDMSKPVMVINAFTVMYHTC